MNDGQPSLVIDAAPQKFFRNRCGRDISYREARRRSVRYRDTRPSNQGKLLFSGMKRRPLPDRQRRRRDVIVQTRVLIIFEPNAMFCSCGARQKSCGSSAVQIVNNIVTVAMKLAS